MMTNGRFRHLPVVGDHGIIGMVDISDVCRALLDMDFSEAPADRDGPARLDIAGAMCDSPCAGSQAGLPSAR